VRRAVLVIGKLFVGLVVVLLAAAAAFLASGPGHALARRLAVAALERVVDGRVRIGSLGGPLWRAIELGDVELAMPDGHPVVRIPRLAMHYAIMDLLRRRFVASRVEIDGPTVVLEEGADGHTNIEHLFRLLEPQRGPPGRRPLVDLRDVQLSNGSFVLRERTDSGTVRERRFLAVGFDLARLRVSHPDSVGIVADIDRLAVSISDPAVRVTDASGRVQIEGDSVRFDLARVALTGTAGVAHGVVRWGKGAAGGRANLDLAANLRRASFADFRWAVAGLPEAGGGRLEVRARLMADGGSSWRFRDADLRSGRSWVRGSADLTIAPHRAVRIPKLDLDAEPLDLALLVPFLGKLPIAGLVNGRLKAAGTLDSLAVGAELAFTDERIPSRPRNEVRGSGVVSLGGRDGFAFRHFAVTQANLALATIELLAPSVTLHGRLEMAGDLDGPWRAATFLGNVSHTDGLGAASRLRGSARLTLADTVHIDADMVADSISLDDIAKSYPAIRLVGMVAGPVRISGPVTALAVEATLAGSGGGVRMAGDIAVRDSLVRISAAGSLDSVDLAHWLPGAPQTRLAGTWRVAVAVPTADTASSATGSLALLFGGSMVAGIELDRAGVTLALTPDRLEIDTAYAEQRGMTFVASGALGRSGRHPAGQVRFDFRADTLGNVGPLISRARRAAGDTARFELGGAGHVKGSVVGTTASWVLQGDLTAGSIAYGPVAAVAARVSGSLERGERGYVFGLRAAAESLAIAGLRYRAVAVTATGPLDSLLLQLGGGFGLGASFQVDLALRVDSSGWTARVAKGSVTLPARVWALARETRITATGDGIAIDSLELDAQNGSRLRVSGRLPHAAAGELSLAVDSVPLSDLYALAERDTTGIGGTVSATLHLVGTAASPRIEAAASLADGRFGDFRAPLVAASAEYRDRRLVFQASLGTGSERVATVSGSLPLDLALVAVAHRQLPDSLRIRVQADSANLAIIDALTTVVRGVSGRLVADLTVRGTWERPELTGSARISGGAVSVPSFGARYSEIEARLTLSGDRLQVEEAHLKGGSGTLEVAGDVRFRTLSRPGLNLRVHARSFAAFSERDFAGLTASGDVELTGPVVGATLTGKLVVDAGFLAFADLVSKRIVNLDDPEFRAIVDSALAQASGVGPSAQSVFLDSLRIRNLTVSMGPDVWLRSHEANIQLAGDFTVSKDVEAGASRYRLDGTLRAVRGTYRLVVGPTSKEFLVTRGTMRFFGTPDLNPVLDIVAEHSVQAINGGTLVVRAVISGTLQVPKLTLESDERPPLSESEIVSYLLFGRPSFDQASGGAATVGTSEQAIFQAAMAGLAGVVSGELEQTLVANLGIPVDYVAIRPGGGTVGDIFSSARIEAGSQVGKRTFITLNAGLCQVARGLSSQTLGASVQYRLTGHWSVEASIEPTAQECRPLGFQIRPPAPYQLGFDLFWQWGAQ
jgi:translocation and assembly module TamB